MKKEYNTTNHLFLSFEDIESGFSAIFDDNGRVAYAYLIDPSGSVSSDVWLYNHASPPLQPEWEDEKNEMPFLNSVEYVKDTVNISEVADESEVSVTWEVCNNKVKATLYLRETRFALLIENQKPGQSLLTAKNSPLSKILKI